MKTPPLEQLLENSLPGSQSQNAQSGFESAQSGFEGFCLLGLGMIPQTIRSILCDWLKEDFGHGDVTLKSLSSLARQPVVARIVAKSQCVVSGSEIAAEIFRLAHGDGGTAGEFFQLNSKIRDGAEVNAGTVLLEIRGHFGALLIAERAALNIFARMTGISTYTKRVFDALQNVSLVARNSGRKVPVLLETRKTTPGLKIFEKYATRVGGAKNHRMGLDSGAMLKENHFRASAKAGMSIYQTILQVKETLPLLMGLEVEVTSMAELKEALCAGCAVVMLDNFSLELIQAAVLMRNEMSPQTLLELSGNLDRLPIEEIALCGVDVCSMGALIHQATWADLSLQFETGS